MSTEQIVLIVSPNSINVLESCGRKYEYYKIRRLGVEGPKDEKLERGDLIHRVCDHYYKALISGKSHAESVEPAIEYGRYQALEMNLEIEASEYFLNVVRDYFQYSNEHYFWKPLHSESPFSLVLYEDETLKILCEGKIDLVIQLEKQPDVIAWVDHKTIAKNFEPSKLDNQFMCYTYAFRELTNYGFVNQIGIQKTLGPADKFHVKTLTYNDANIAEWRETVIYHCKKVESYIRAGYFPMNHSQCWQCQYKDICKEPPNLREKMIELKYKEMPPHDLFAEKA